MRILQAGEIENLDEICLVKAGIMAKWEVSVELDENLAGRRN